MIKNYFKIAIRNFSRHKVFTFINIIGLSIGISAALVIYLIVHFDLTFNRFKNRENIYRVVSFSTFQGDPNYNSGVCGPITVAINGQGKRDICICAVFHFVPAQCLHSGQPKSAC